MTEKIYLSEHTKYIVTKHNGRSHKKYNDPNNCSLLLKTTKKKKYDTIAHSRLQTSVLKTK